MCGSVVIRKFVFLLPLLAACGAPEAPLPATDPDGGLTGRVLETRLANTEMTLSEFGKSDVTVLRLKADRTMTVRLNSAAPMPYAWQIKGNQLCTTPVVGGQVMASGTECGIVSIRDSSVTLKQTTSSTGGGDVLTGRIAPL